MCLSGERRVPSKHAVYKSLLETRRRRSNPLTLKKQTLPPWI